MQRSGPKPLFLQVDYEALRRRVYGARADLGQKQFQFQNPRREEERIRGRKHVQL